jgi:peptidyl-prolyl cis-trans isomerase SurA
MRYRFRLALLLLLGAVPPAMVCRPAMAQQDAAPHDADSIVAIVNGDVISREDVNARRRLFALSTGLPLSQDVLERLAPQITRQLIDERLRLQEVQRRRILVSDKEIAAAITDIEARNGMPPGTLRMRLAQDGVSYRTLVDQTRVQMGWTRVLRQKIGEQAQITDADIAEQERLLKEQLGQPEFRVGEVFIPIDQPAAAEDAQRFADTVIQELRAGAPFPVVAAQFSQSQTALQGGDLGWVQAPQLDPEVLRVLDEMPVGAVSNPVRVPGGIDIVSLHGKREVGHDMATMLSVRQVFLPFSSRLDSNNPTEQQRQTLTTAQHISATTSTCDAMEAANKAAAGPRPANPGDLRLEGLPGPMRAVLEKLPDNHASQPLVAEDGIMVLMVCSRTQKNLGVPSREELADHILNERFERASRQLMRELQRRAMLDQRS